MGFCDHDFLILFLEGDQALGPHLAVYQYSFHLNENIAICPILEGDSQLTSIGRRAPANRQQSRLVDVMILELL